MPLTEKGEKIKGAMQEKYGSEKGEEVFYKSKNAGTITGVDTHLAPHPVKGAPTRIRERELERMEKRRERNDDNQHMGFAGGDTPKAGELRQSPDRADLARRLVAHCDRFSRRLDAFEKRKNQSQPERVKPRTKDGMQPSNRHPKEI